jgi:prepilin-type N-terminal cleavage/methylation domain-containing protein
MKTEMAIIHRRGRRGFSLVEVSIVSGLMAVLAVMLANAWSGLGRPLLEAAVRTRLAQEADLALASLSRDLGGYLSDTVGRTGGKATYLFVGRLQPGGSQLWLCFDGGSSPNGQADWAPPDTVISYEVVGNALVRWDQTAGTSFVVARNVNSFQLQDLGNELQISLTLSFRTVSQTYTLIAKDP